MNNRIETLRAICYTKEDLENITNLGDIFSEKDIEFLVEFKKIYELGLEQLKKFIDKLDKEGSELDTYSIRYYVDILLNGPLGVYVREFAKENRYFSNFSDSIGNIGNNNKSPSNVTVYQNMGYPLGCSVDTYNKLPDYIQQNLISSIKTTEDVFRSSLYSSSIVDNTLPIADKNNQLRYSEEDKGKWVERSNASYLVKDSSYSLTISKISSQVFDIVKEQLGDDVFKIYEDVKKYNPFGETNESTSTNSKVKKKYKDGEKTREVEIDLMGNEFDSETNRSFKMKLDNDSKDEEFLLNSNQGQLGN